LFHGPVRVPADAATGQAKITFSFDAWLEGRVEPTTIELPLVAPQPKDEKESRQKEAP
jgi:hypothetical protein